MFGFGPFVGVSVGQYVSSSGSNGAPGTSSSGDIPNKDFHEWVQIGVRFSLDAPILAKAAKDDTDPPPDPSGL
jgi:hypothetical protein